MQLLDIESKVEAHVIYNKSHAICVTMVMVQKAIKVATNCGSNTREVKADYLNLDSVSATRIKCDLAHVYMPTAIPFFVWIHLWKEEHILHQK
eukprot:CCRYP_008453-RA/>CCRYP_008453-RA protein AED:0.61 eAED:0.67 QI:0/0/0/1/0/0/2/0/92